MATPETRLRDGVKRMPSMDTDWGKAYMRGDVVVRLIDCKRLDHPQACDIFDDLVASDTVGKYTHLSPLQLSHEFKISLIDARALWQMIMLRPGMRLTIGVDPA